MIFPPILQQPAPEAAVAAVLDDFHAAAAQADEARYFGHLDDKAVFLGTDASERWTKAQFQAYAHPYFSARLKLVEVNTYGLGRFVDWLADADEQGKRLSDATIANIVIPLRAALTTAVLSVAFSAFWSTLALMLHQRHGLGSDIAGAFGLAGAAGAIAARMAGALSDRIGTHRVTRLAAGLVTASFLAMGTAEALPMTAQLAVIAFATVTFDLGFQSSLVAHQTLVYSLDPAARGRLNAVLFTVMFSGMALGSVLGTQALALAGWPGVIGLTVLASGTGLLLRLTAPTPVSVTPASAAPLKEAEAEA